MTLLRAEEAPEEPEGGCLHCRHDGGWEKLEKGIGKRWMQGVHLVEVFAPRQGREDQEEDV